MSETYDVVVLGGGAAGLSGALALGRARRSVLVVDGGQPRNAPAGHMHNYLGREALPPTELLATGRQEVEQYGVEIVDADAEVVTREDGGAFAITIGHRHVKARRVLLATGALDELPPVAGLAEEWGKTVLHCPYCHGWEVRDEALGILATSSFSIHQAQLFRQLSDDVVLFQHTAPPLSEEVVEELAARHIRVVQGEVASWEPGRVRLASGEVVERQALVVASTIKARADVVAALGLKPVELTMAGVVIATYIPTDPTGLTDVTGVYAAGNVTDPRAQVIVSAGAGLMAAAAINADLVADDTRLAVERHRLFTEEAWEDRYRVKEGGIWSGNPNAVLVAEAADLAPGTALDVGCGEGADALWLAARGWRVTGADISTVALGRAAELAKARGLEVEWRHVDLLEESPEPGSFDLVSVHFMQLPTPQRARLYNALAAAVRPGGTLLVVAHHPSYLPTATAHQHLHDMMFTAEQLLEEIDLDGWEIQLVAARPRQAKDPDGHEITIRDTILRARRASP